MKMPYFKPSNIGLTPNGTQFNTDALDHTGSLADND